MSVGSRGRGRARGRGRFLILLILLILVLVLGWCPVIPLTPDTRNLIGDVVARSAKPQTLLKNSRNIPDGDEGHRKNEDNLYDFGGQVLLKSGAAIYAQKAAGSE